MQTSAVFILRYKDLTTGKVYEVQSEIDATEYVYSHAAPISAYGLECCTAMAAVEVLKDMRSRRKYIRDAVNRLAADLIHQIEVNEGLADPVSPAPSATRDLL